MDIEDETCAQKTLSCFVVDPLKPFAVKILVLEALGAALRDETVEERFN